MENTINLGIDLGTTNSLIAEFHEGEVKIYRNPVTWKDTLASVVAYRKNRILVGDKAREFMEKDSQNVFGNFKRKMGTSESYIVKSINEKLTPVDLSAQVISHLKTFAQNRSVFDSVVVTIPASFDTVQANATKQAGHKAGFEQVVLLQEPIAASLAFANARRDFDLSNGYWIVYDLGGGTFDVAIVRIDEEEMRIVDHEGDNFLGGKDFDAAIVEQIVFPTLKFMHSLDNFDTDFKSANGKFNKEWYVLMKKAEDLKIELSANQTSEIEVVISDDENVDIDELIEVKREKFEEIIAPYIDKTCEMIERMLIRNKLQNSDIQFTLMVGGSTYIPLVKQKLSAKFNIPINTDIDPTSAVAIGAAYYAGTKMKEVQIKEAENTISMEESLLKVKMAYEKASKDTEVFFTAIVEGDFKNKFYKITRQDGGFDTGQKLLEAKINESLPLVTNSFNFFSFKIYDKKGNEVFSNADPIGVAQGKYSIVGQPLPEDICLEIDDPDNDETVLHTLFKRNSVLPVSREETRIMNKTIHKDSDEKFIINVLEGSASAIPETNKTIGYMSITGKELKRDLIKGADVELSFEITESRDLRITAYIAMLDQEFVKIFTPTQRHIPLNHLVEEVQDLIHNVALEISVFASSENYEIADILSKCKQQLESLKSEANRLAEDDITDKRYQLEDLKRKIALDIYEITKDRKINDLTRDYYAVKHEVQDQLEQNGTVDEKQKYDKILEQEVEILNSLKRKAIQRLSEELSKLKFEIYWRSDTYQTNLFYWLMMRQSEFSNQTHAQTTINQGEEAIEKENFQLLKQVNVALLDMLPEDKKNEAMHRSTGLI